VNAFLRTVPSVVKSAVYSISLPEGALNRPETPVELRELSQLIGQPRAPELLQSGRLLPELVPKRGEGPTAKLELTLDLPSSGQGQHVLRS
jgi:hypothetical protein